MNKPLFCFGSLMDWDTVRCVLNSELEHLSMQVGTLPGYRVAKLPHETYPLLVQDEYRIAKGQLLCGLSNQELDRIIFFEGEEYEIQPCRVEVEGGIYVEAMFFDEGIMPAAEMVDWEFSSWCEQCKPFMLRQSAKYMSYYGKMSAQEADYYWQTYSEEEEFKKAS